MSVLDELEARFAIADKLRAAIARRFGSSMHLSVRWWPKRDAPTSAFVGAHRGGARGGGVPAPTDTSMPDIEGWFIVARDVVEEAQGSALLSRAIEYMSPIPHDAVMSVVDAFEFFQLGRVMRERPSTLATDFAEVWHAPKMVDGRLVFFSLHPDMKLHRVSVDVTTARVDDTLLA